MKTLRIIILITILSWNFYLHAQWKDETTFGQVITDLKVYNDELFIVGGFLKREGSTCFWSARYDGNSFTNQTLAQIELWNNSDQYDNEVYMLPKHLDEKVAALHLAKIGVELDVLSKDQADYIGVNVEGPFKPEHYRY